MLDKRFKHREKDVKEFYLFIKHKKSHIYYMKYRSGNGFKCKSTGETDIKLARIAAYKLIDSDNKVVEAKSDMSIFDNYYKLGPNGEMNDYLLWDMSRGIEYNSAKALGSKQYMLSRCKRILNCKSLQQITKKKIIDLQEELAKEGFSASTIHQHIMVMKRMFDQLVAKQIIMDNPAQGIKKWIGKKEERGCFPLELFEHRLCCNNDDYCNMGIIAMTTGMRRSEIQRIQLEDFIQTDYGLMLKVRGTKTENAVRTIPVPDITKEAFYRCRRQLAHSSDDTVWSKCVLYWCNKVGYPTNKMEEEHIVFHSFRKMYKTAMVQANLNDGLQNYLMGHSQSNQRSTDVHKVYFVEGSADFEELYKLAIKAISYFIK